MKRLKTTVAIVTMTPWILFSGELARTNNQVDLPRQVDFVSVSDEVRERANKLPTVELRLNYLSLVVTSNSENNSDSNNFNKASAIRLLGAIANTNSIGLLISNLTFVDLRLQDHPAITAVANIGEAATPRLLDVLQDSSAPPEKYDHAVRSLLLIKKVQGNPNNLLKWDQFLDDQKRQMPREAWDRLWKYGSSID